MADEAFENFDDEAPVQVEQPVQVLEDSPVVQTAELPEIKLFGRWTSDDIDISDISVSVSTKILFLHVPNGFVVHQRSTL